LSCFFVFIWQKDPHSIKHSLELIWLVNWVNLIKSVRANASQIHILSHLVLWSQRFWIIEPKLVNLTIGVNVIEIRCLEIVVPSYIGCHVVGRFVGQDCHDVLVCNFRSSGIRTVNASKRNEGEITGDGLVISSIFTWVVVTIPWDTHY